MASDTVFATARIDRRVGRGGGCRGRGYEDEDEHEDADSVLRPFHGGHVSGARACGAAPGGSISAPRGSNVT